MKVVAILFCLTLFCFAKEGVLVEKKTDFLRVKESEKSAKLQTAITTYEKDGAKVALIGAIHIADQSYYDALNKKFATYDRVLFEMIGGERMGEIQKQGEKPSFLGKTYAAVAGFLKLTDQKTAVDYSAKNFVHADLSLTEFKALQEKRGESLLSFAVEASQAADKKKQPSMIKLLTAMITGDSDKVKLQLIGTLGDGDDQIGAFAGESVIITDRNAKCLQVLDAQLKAGHENLGIFYGAAHFPDMEETLKEKGFTIVKQEWLNAWTVQK
ncbi:hypothetical protein OAK89_00585 [Akkermansiaceae bacterium]|nr:hypothetical protein [bacterium]MDB4462401.1 hypothetical protein [Akkermansiaceae bacterium]MDC0286696.1 hypothetical protein [Akkermansiaceae bacterium]